MYRTIGTQCVTIDQFIDSHIYYLSTVDKCKGNKLDCFKSALTIINSLSDPNFMLYKRLTSKEPGEIYFMIYHTLNRLRSTTRDLPIKNRLINTNKSYIRNVIKLPVISNNFNSLLVDLDNIPNISNMTD